MTGQSVCRDDLNNRFAMNCPPMSDIAGQYIGWLLHVYETKHKELGLSKKEFKTMENVETTPKMAPTIVRKCYLYVGLVMMKNFFIFKVMIVHGCYSQ